MLSKNPGQNFGFVAWSFVGGYGPQNLMSKYIALTVASNSYIVKVVGQSTILSPGSSTQL